MLAELNDRAVISLSGPEAREFLQGLITNDVKAIAPDHPVYAALLTPQGKILFDFLISEAEDGLFIDCYLDTSEALVKRLSLYKLRAKVDVKLRNDVGVFTDTDAANSDPRHPALARRRIGPIIDAPSGASKYMAQRLDLGIPEGADFGSDRMFALDAGLDELHAVSFDKGCYVGQELTARMKHRGTARKRLLPVATIGGNPLPARDVPVTAGGQEIGAISSVYGARGFAVVRLDRLTDTADTPLEAGGVAISVTKPSWLFP